MSATVDSEKIAAYMGDCPVITVPGRTFPVTPYFLEDVVELTRYRLEPQTDSPYVARKMRREFARRGAEYQLTTLHYRIRRSLARTKPGRRATG